MVLLFLLPRLQPFDRNKSSCYTIKILTTIIGFLISNTIATCFYPDGSHSNDQPCDPSASNSMCCAYGTNCLMNGVCHSMTDIGGNLVSTYARGSCTDQSWQSSSCINQCIYDGVYDQWGPLVPCSNNIDAFFCYFQDRNNDGEHCEQRSDVFTLVGGNSIRTTIGVAVSTQVSTQISTQLQVSTIKSVETSIATVFVAPSPSPSPSPSPTPNLPSSNTSPRNNPPPNTFSTIVPGRKTTTSDPSAGTNVAESASASGVNPVVIGGAVGGSVGAVCLCLIAYLAYILGKRRQADKMTPSEPMWQVPPGPNQTYGQYPVNIPIPPMMVHHFAPAPVPPAQAQTPGPIPPAPAGGLPPGYTPYNPQFFGPALAPG